MQNVSKQLKSVEPPEIMLKEEYNLFLKTRSNLKVPSDKIKSYESWCKEGYARRGCSGKIHSCVVDIDNYNHIFLNPFDGTVIPYYKLLKEKQTYKNIKALIKDKKPEVYDSYIKFLKVNKKMDNIGLYKKNSIDSKFLISRDNRIYKLFFDGNEGSMDIISDKMKIPYYICLYKYIQVWNDEVLDSSED